VDAGQAGDRRIAGATERASALIVLSRAVLPLVILAAAPAR
jgi:hypothetical protein